MAGNNSPLMDFKKTSSTEWESRGVNRGFSGVIVEDLAAVPGDVYELTITPGPVVTTHETLLKAKQQFRTFLLDKPVVL